MIQQVNLYQDSRRLNKSHGLYYHLLAISSVFLFLIVYSSLTAWNTYQLKNAVQLKKSNLGQTEDRLKLLQIQHPKPQINSLLVAEVSRSQNRLNSLTQIVQLLTANESDQIQGFSKYFHALASQPSNDVWLEEIGINNNVQDVSLKGSTFKPEQIALFLQQLQEQPAFHGKTFARLAIEKSESRPSQVDFTLSTTIKSDDD